MPTIEEIKQELAWWDSHIRPELESRGWIYWFIDHPEELEKFLKIYWGLKEKAEIIKNLDNL